MKYLTPAEAAKLWGVTRRTIYTWLRAGTIKGKKIGGVWRVMAR